MPRDERQAQISYYEIANTGGLNVRSDLERVTLGLVGQPIHITEPQAGGTVLVVVPLDLAAAVGIDLRTVRLFRMRRARMRFDPVWDSNVSPDFGRLWARIDGPGTYVAIGLPSDPLLRELLRNLAEQRRYRGVGTPEYRQQITSAAFSAFAEMSKPELEELRSLLTRAETVRDPFRFAPTDIVRGYAGKVLPPPLPHGMNVDEFREVLHALSPPASGLPEEQLFYDPHRIDDPRFALAPTPPGADAIVDERESGYIRELIDGTEHTGVRAAVTRITLPDRFNWWMYHHDPQHTGNIPGSHITRQTVGLLRLRMRLPLAGPVISVPAVVNNKIYVGIGNSALAAFGSGGTLYKIDLLTGALERQFTFNTALYGGSRQGFTGIACTPTVTGGRVYFSAQDGRIYCLNADTLTPVWITNLRTADPLHNQPVTHTVNAQGWASPLVINGRVYVGFGESESNTFGFIYCLDADTGNVVWLFCTTVFPGVDDNEPNVIPESAVGVPRLPPGFTTAPDPLSRGASPWSSCAYDPVSNRIVVGTGNVLPQHPLPQPKYSLGVLSLDALTGGSPRFFQPSNADNYRPDDTDVDVPPGPTLFRLGRRRVVAIGSKCGSFFLLDADSMEAVARRQLLPRAGGNGGFPGDTGLPLPGVDPHPPDPIEGRRTENFYGIFGSTAIHYELRRLFVGVGGFAFGVGTPGIDYTTTAFLRALNWNDLTDAWPTAVALDGVRRYISSTPPMYMTPGEAGFSSPVVVNDVVLVSTSRPGVYAFDAETGLALWAAPGIGPAMPNSYTLGPVVYGDFLVVGSANLGLLVYSL